MPASADEHDGRCGEPHWPSAAVARLLAEALRETEAALALAPTALAQDQARLPTAEAARLTPAAVLIPIEVGQAGARVLLTRRTEHLHHHPGQVSFPGGRIEAGDTDPVAAALRETEEEIGLGGARVRVIGTLREYRSRTGFCIHPVVGLVEPQAPLRLDSFEVAHVLRVPLGFLLDPGNRTTRPSTDTPSRTVYSLRYGEEEIWGVTAGIVVELHARLAASRHFSELWRCLSA